AHQPKREHSSDRTRADVHETLAITAAERFTRRLGQRPPHAEVEEPEIADQPPRQRQNPETVLPKPLDEDRYGDDREQKRRDLSGEVERRISRQQAATRHRVSPRSITIIVAD